ncbi:right-handed parallel beta-helix repeat-containing protein [Streptosporangium sp. NPDC051023]|uniref:right-handed parallel beta-helix repeat-containing protein n=1 Tax=Streptosporangium sp. NPDC051023 TaxID=3155410 RepID=UPI00344FB881
MNHGKEPGRRHPAKVGAAFALTLLAALGAPLPASASDDEVRCGAVLTSDVTLTGNLNCAGDALTIGANGVTVDLNGHTITGDGTGRGITLEKKADVTVQNGTITRFKLGAEATESHLTFSQVQLVGNPVKATRVSSLTLAGTPETCLAEGVDVTDFSVLTIDRCTVHGLIHGVDGRQWTVKGSTLSNGYAQLVENGSAAFTGNVFDNFPVDLVGGTNNNLYANNVFQNASVAFRAEFSMGAPNTLEDNVFRNNDFGMAFWSTFYNVSVSNNLFEGNRAAGILIDPSRTIATNPYPIIDNVFEGNGLAPNGAADRAGNPVKDGIHVAISTGTPVKLTHNSGGGNGGFVIWGPAGQVTDGGNNHGPCGPEANPGLDCY